MLCVRKGILVPCGDERGRENENENEKKKSCGFRGCIDYGATEATASCVDLRGPSQTSLQESGCMSLGGIFPNISVFMKMPF